MQEPSHIVMMSCSQNFQEWKVLDKRAIPKKIPVSSACLDPRGEFIALGHKNGSVSIWSVGFHGLKYKRVFPNHHDFAVNDIVFFGSRKTSNTLTPPILTVSGDGICRMHPTTPSSGNIISLVGIVVLIFAVFVSLLGKFAPEYVPELVLEVVRPWLVS